MLVCDCWFWRNHQEGVTAKELAQITERAKQLRVTLVSDNGEVRIYLVKGGETNHYVTKYPGGDGEVYIGMGDASKGLCKHIIAVRNLETQPVPEVVGVEDSGEVDPPTVSTGVSAVG